MADIVYIEQGYYVGDNYYTYTADASATLNVAAQVQCDGSTIKPATIDITSAFTPTLTASVLKNHTAQLDVVITITVSAENISTAQSTLDNIVTLSLQGDRQRDLASTTLSSEFTQNTQILRIQSSNSDLNCAFTVNADGDVLGAAVEASATFNTEFTTQCVNDTIRGGSSQQSAQCDISCAITRIRSTAVDLLTSFQSANIVVGELHNAVITIADAFTPTITVSVLKNHTAVLDVVCTITCSANKIIGFVMDLHSESVFTVSAFKSVSVGSSMLNVFTVGTPVLNFNSTVSAAVIVTATINYHVQFNTQITVGKRIRFTDTLVVTVTNVGLVFYIDGVAQPTITLLQGNTYIFNHPSNHPIAFSTTPNGTHSGGTEYTTGITRDVYNYKLIFTVGYDTPTLYYYCQYHSGMGNTALTPRPTVDIISTVTAASLIFQSKWYGTHRPVAWYKNDNRTEFVATNGSEPFQAEPSIDSFLRLRNDRYSSNTVGTGTVNRGVAVTNIDPSGPNGSVVAPFTTQDFVFEMYWRTTQNPGQITSVIAKNMSWGGIYPNNPLTYYYGGDFINQIQNPATYATWRITVLYNSRAFSVDLLGRNFPISGQSHFETNQWVRIEFSRTGNVFKFMVNNTVLANSTVDGVHPFNSTGGQIVLINGSLSTTSTAFDPVYFDYANLQYKVGTSVLSSGLLPYRILQPNDNTQIAAQNTFDNFSLTDNLASNLDGGANLAVTATVTALAGKSVSASAQLNSTHTLVAIIGEVFTTSVTLNAEFTHTTTGTRIKQFDSVILVEFTHTTVAQRTLPGSATITAQHTLALTITRIFVLQSNFESIATQLTSVARVGAGLILAEVFVSVSANGHLSSDVVSTMSVISSITVSADRVRLTTVSTAVEFNLNAANSRIRALNSALQTDSALTVLTVRIRSTNSTQNSEFVIFCDAFPIIRANSNQSAQFTQQTLVDRIRLTSVTLNTNFTQQSTGIIAVNAVAAFSTQSQINCEVVRIRPGVVIMDAIAVNVTAAAKTGTALVTIEIQSQCTTTAQKTTDIQLNAVNTAELTSIIERIQQGVANITATFNLTVNGILSTDVAANFNTEFNHTITAQKTVRVNVNISSAGNFVMAVVAIRNYEIIIITQTNITAAADRRRNTGANLTTDFTVNALAGVLAVANSVQNTQFAITAAVSKLRLDDIVLYIKTESRSHSINNEQRSYALQEENRLYTLEE